jgi:hypothetical protein
MTKIKHTHTHTHTHKHTHTTQKKALLLDPYLPYIISSVESTEGGENPGRRPVSFPILLLPSGDVGKVHFPSPGLCFAIYKKSIINVCPV